MPAYTLSTPTIVNGNGNISGRGIRRRRRHLNHHQRVELAAALAGGRVSFKPSFGQAAALLGVPRAEVSATVKKRAAKDAAANLVLAWSTAAPAERMAAVEEIGVAGVWDIIAAVVA